MQKNKLAFIGGSGIYNLDIFEKIIEHDIVSVFGKPSSKIIEGKINNNSIFFLSRHGIDHRISPSEINYRANIECLKQLEITDIVSLSAVGSLQNNLDPGTFVIVDQYIDRTVNRKKTFFEDGIVAHVPMAEPTNKILMNISKDILESLNIKHSFCKNVLWYQKRVWCILHKYLIHLGLVTASKTPYDWCACIGGAVWSITFDGLLGIGSFEFCPKELKEV